MSLDGSLNPLIQIKSTHKLFEFIYLRVYPTQSVTTHIILVQISGLSFAIHISNVTLVIFYFLLLF